MNKGNIMIKIIMAVLLFGLTIGFAQVGGQTVYVHTSGSAPTVKQWDIEKQVFTNGLFISTFQTAYSRSVILWRAQIPQICYLYAKSSFKKG